MDKLIALLIAVVAALSGSAAEKPCEFVKPPLSENAEITREFVKPPLAGNNDNFVLVENAQNGQNAHMGAENERQGEEKVPGDDGFMPPVPSENPREREEERSVPPVLGASDKQILTADELFELQKRALDDKYARMFELKERIDELGREQDGLCGEYYSLRQSYERELKRLTREWASSPLEK